MRTYVFLSQVVSFTDARLQRDYLYCKALAAFTKVSGDDVAVDAGSLVELTHLRIEQQFEGSVTLNDTIGEVVSVFDGTGKKHEPDEEPLSLIIEQINERFGTSWGPTDRLFFDAVADKLVRRPDISNRRPPNSPETFALVMAKQFEGGVIDQMAAAEDLTIKYLDNPDLQTMVLQAYAPLIQGKARSPTRSTARSPARRLELVGAIAAARHELAVDLVADLERLRVQRCEARQRIATAVTASKTTLTELFGVGPIVAATVIGDVGDIVRFPTRDRFAAYNGTAPIEVSSGGRRKVFRLSRRGNPLFEDIPGPERSERVPG